MNIYLIPAPNDPHKLTAPGLLGTTVPLAHVWDCTEHGRYYTAWCAGCDTKDGRQNSRSNFADLTSTITAKIAEGVMEKPNALVLVHGGKVVTEGYDRAHHVWARSLPAELWMPTFPSVDDAQTLAGRIAARLGGEVVVQV